MITAFAALEEGATTPSEEIRDLGEFDKIDPAAKCHIYPSSHGLVNIVEALKVSCNYFFYEMGWRLSINNGKFDQQLGLSKLEKYATLFGLNEPSGIEMNESEPEISTEDSVRSSIGQGSNVYTPVQLARYITTLANRGTCYDLTLIDRTVDQKGNVTINNAKVDHVLKDIQESTWKSVWEGMYSVVNEPGGSVYNLYKNLGVTVAGKTGTSQISKVNPNNALFVSFAPYEKPEISITAVIPRGYTSSNAASLEKDIYKIYFELEDVEDVLDHSANLPEGSNIDAVLE
jgi:penicillin-binding protein 2